MPRVWIWHIYGIYYYAWGLDNSQIAKYTYAWPALQEAQLATPLLEPNIGTLQIGPE
jgi:hypothetical protein